LADADLEGRNQEVLLSVAPLALDTVTDQPEDPPVGEWPAIRADGDPIGRDASGVYAAAEKNIWKGAEKSATAFVRAGVSDGRTSDFAGSVQAGVLFDRPVAARPDSHVAIGIATAFTSDGFQDNARDAGFDPADHETALEFTYSDNLFPWLTVQPDLQLTFNPGGDKDADLGVTAGLRITIQPWSN